MTESAKARQRRRPPSRFRTGAVSLDLWRPDDPSLGRRLEGRASATAGGHASSSHDELPAAEIVAEPGQSNSEPIAQQQAIIEAESMHTVEEETTESHDPQQPKPSQPSPNTPGMEDVADESAAVQRPESSQPSWPAAVEAIEAQPAEVTSSRSTGTSRHRAASSREDRMTSRGSASRAADASIRRQNAWPELPLMETGIWQGRPIRGCGFIAFRESAGVLHTCMVTLQRGGMRFPKGHLTSADDNLFDCLYRTMLLETGVSYERIAVHARKHLDDDRLGCRYLIGEVHSERDDIDHQITDLGWEPPRDNSSEDVDDPIARAHWAPVKEVLYGQWAGVRPDRITLLQQAVRLRPRPPRAVDTIYITPMKQRRVRPPTPPRAPQRR